MDIMELGAIGELVGGVAVIGSLTLVGVREWALGTPGAIFMPMRRVYRLLD